jgi:hypothetical protein
MPNANVGSADAAKYSNGVNGTFGQSEALAVGRQKTRDSAKNSFAAPEARLRCHKQISERA